MEVPLLSAPSGCISPCLRITDQKARQAIRIKELAAALAADGLVTLGEQARALGLSRSSAWAVLKANHKASGLAAGTINQMLSSPALPPRARVTILTYVDEKLAGLYGHNKTQLRRFAAGAFRQGMHEQGWSEGRNLQIEYRWAGPDARRIKAFAAELVGTSPSVILALTSPSVAALREVTRTVPIIFVGIGDPVGQGFVASLARPDGNITGFTGFEFSLGEKWLGYLKELAPGVSRAAFLFHPELGPYYSSWLKSVEAAATALGVQMTAAPIRAAADVEAAISTIAALPNGGLVVEPDAYTSANRRLIIEFAARYRLPAVYAYPRDAAEGGLVSAAIRTRTPSDDDQWRARR
jgi:ABC-type uncharacterized transport system substrate-binding protein